MRLCLILLLVSTAAVAQNLTRGVEGARLFGVHEIVMKGDAAVGNPFDTRSEVELEAPSGRVVKVTAFYDGGGLWKARAYVSEPGRWRWRSKSPDDRKLDGGHGVFEASRSNLPGKLRPHPRNPRQWATDNGETFVNLSDTAYLLFRSAEDETQPVSDEAFRLYVKDAAGLGVTSLRAGALGGYAGWSRQVRGTLPEYNRSNWCWEKDYGEPDYWESYDLNRLQTTDRRLEWLLNRYPGVAVQLILFGKTSTPNPKRSVGAMWAEIPEPYRERTVEHLVARFSAFPQVFFQIVNDTNFGGEAGPANQRMVREIGRMMARLDPWDTLRSAGAKRREVNPFTLESDWRQWHTYLHIEKYSEIDCAVCDRYGAPVHFYYGEDWYEQGPLDNRHRLNPVDPRYYYRRLFWSVLLSGGSPNYGGRYPVLHSYTQTGRLKFRASREQAYEDALTGLDDVAPIRRFLETRSIDLALFEPDDAAVETVPASDGPDRAQCARRGRDEYLVYLPCAAPGERSGGAEDSPEAEGRLRARVDPQRTPSVRIDLREAEGKFAVEWYRAHDGVVKRSGPVAAGAILTLTSPWKGADVVVRLYKVGEFSLESAAIVALKAGRGDLPQTTLYSYKQNLRDGVSLDMDIRKTADGDIIVIHDETTGRLCDQDWTVKDRTVAELKTLDAAWQDEGFRGRGLRLATLDEALELFAARKRPGAIVWIDTKDDEDYPFEENQQLYDRLVELIGKHYLWREAHIEVSRAEEAEALRARDSRIRVVTWKRTPEEVDEALRYPHYRRIGVPAVIAAEVAERIRDAGRKLHITNSRFTPEQWREVERLRPASIAADRYRELLGR